MHEHPDRVSVADLLGPWEEPDWDSGLIDRCRRAWHKPVRELTNEELATFIRQHIAIQYVLPIAEDRIRSGYDDDTEIYDGELRAAVDNAKNSI